MFWDYLLGKHLSSLIQEEMTFNFSCASICPEIWIFPSTACRERTEQREQNKERENRTKAVRTRTSAATAWSNCDIATF